MWGVHFADSARGRRRKVIRLDKPQAGKDRKGLTSIVHGRSGVEVIFLGDDVIGRERGDHLGHDQVAERIKAILQELVHGRWRSDREETRTERGVRSRAGSRPWRDDW